jgi:hypothetical protein
MSQPSFDGCSVSSGGAKWRRSRVSAENSPPTNHENSGHGIREPCSRIPYSAPKSATISSYWPAMSCQEMGVPTPSWLASFAAWPVGMS